MTCSLYLKIPPLGAEDSSMTYFICISQKDCSLKHKYETNELAFPNTIPLQIALIILMRACKTRHFKPALDPPPLMPLCNSAHIPSTFTL